MARTQTETETGTPIKVGDTIHAAGQTWTIASIDGDTLTINGADGTVRTATVAQVEPDGVNP